MSSHDDANNLERYIDRLPDEFREKLTHASKRARIVAALIARDGYVTSDTLRQKYYYHHPPRAIRDLKDVGIPVVTSMVTTDNGRRIACYTFGEKADNGASSKRGRRPIPKAFRKKVIAEFHGTCVLCSTPYPSQQLQVDHRIPYMIEGDEGNSTLTVENFMVLCRECNRAKSWVCETCNNGAGVKDPNVCRECYWAFPEHYSHVATVPIRRLTIVWRGEQEIAIYGILEDLARSEGKPMADIVKEAVAHYAKDVKILSRSDCQEQLQSRDEP